MMLLVSCGILLAQKPAVVAADLEARALSTFAAGDWKAYGRIVEEYRRLSPDARRQLPFRLRDRGFDVHFQGEHPAKEFVAGMLEYLVATEDKAYEALLVVDRGEIDRAELLTRVLKAGAAKKRPYEVEVSLAFSEEGTVRVERLVDLIASAKPEDRGRFLREAWFTEHGLRGATNVASDSALLPKKKTAATLVISVRAAARKKKR